MNAATVSVKDPRLAAFISATLAPLGFRVERTPGPPATSESSDLWVTQAGSLEAEAARRYIDEHPGAQLVVIGENGDAGDAEEAAEGDDWDDDGRPPAVRGLDATFVPGDAGPLEICDAIRRAVVADAPPIARRGRPKGPGRHPQ
jgi:hypothetical protein